MMNSVAGHSIRQVSCPVFTQTPKRCKYFTTAKGNINKRASIRATRSIPSSFGIIAAINKQNIIGINGALPWKYLPEDKAHFVSITRNKVMIIGRKSFIEEDPSGDHLHHVRACIVLSRSMKESDLQHLNEQRGGPELKLARCFAEALHFAYELNHSKNQCEKEVIDCWVAGGEGIYREALTHGSLREVNLTHVDMQIDEDLNQFQENNRVTFFPMEIFHQIGFNEVSRSVGDSCCFCLYKGNDVLR